MPYSLGVFWSFLFRTPSMQLLDVSGVLWPADSEMFDVVGEQFVSENVLAMRNAIRENARFWPYTVFLSAEPTNPHDSNAVAIYFPMVRQGFLGRSEEAIRVGYLPREQAKTFHSSVKLIGYPGLMVQVAACVVWHDEQNRGGVKISLPLNFATLCKTGYCEGAEHRPPWLSGTEPPPLAQHGATESAAHSDDQLRMIYCRYAQWKAWNCLPAVIDEKLAAWQHGAGPVGLAIAFNETGIDECGSATQAPEHRESTPQKQPGTTKMPSRSRKPAASASKHLAELLTRSHTLHGAVLLGLDGLAIELQARAMEVLDDPDGISWRDAVGITGMAKGSVQEALDRISGAFRAAGVPGPKVEILVNLTPPNIPKDGTWLDLPLAIIMLQAAGELPDLSDQQEGGYVLVGELGIHGEIRRVPGVLSLAYMARPGQKLVVPSGNEKEAALILAKPGHEGCGVYPVAKLADVIEFFRGTKKLDNALKQKIVFESVVDKAVDFGKIRGQAEAKEAAVLAAAGGHNLLLIGPPGEGKSLLASAMPGILPRLTDEEKVQLTRIYSAAGLLDKDGQAVTRRPMRSVHHTASKQAIVGGGSGVPRPGEITMAHLGILFLDEIAEFSSATLESLRQPLESGEIAVSRVGGTFIYPCRFALVAAMNPCPCGFFGTDRCRCSPQAIKKYQAKISGPISDRIDLQVVLAPLTTDERFAPTADDVSPALRRQVELARQRQQSRFVGRGVPFNAAIPGGSVVDLCSFSPAGMDYYKSTIDANTLSTRSMDRLAKVARTAADLADADFVEQSHIETAARFVVGGMLRENL
jgi:magnesium chelatase family protein